MRTVPLHGKKAAGRVALVDDGDYEFVMQYRWHVWENRRGPDRRIGGPYAVAITNEDGHRRDLRMHSLIMGTSGVDHIDHDGLNNQRYNLRPATTTQNNRNTRGKIVSTSKYKGVSWHPERRIWRAAISDGRIRTLGRFVSELEAAYTYDAAARELFGEYAHTNFLGGPTQAMRAEWEAEREAHRAAGVLNHAQSGTSAGWWAEREPQPCICAECGAEYQSRGQGKQMYCPDCRRVAANRRRRENRKRQREGNY